MPEPDAIAAAVLAELRRREGGEDELSVAELARRATALCAEAIHQPDLHRWLKAERSMRADKAAAVLEVLGLVVAPVARVRKRPARRGRRAG